MIGWEEHMELNVISNGFTWDHPILSIPSQWYDRMGRTHGIKCTCISDGFTWDIDHPLYPNSMIGCVIVQ